LDCKCWCGITEKRGATLARLKAARIRDEFSDIFGLAGVWQVLPEGMRQTPDWV